MTVKNKIVDEIKFLFDKDVNADNLSIDQLEMIFEGLLCGIDTIDLFEDGLYNPDQMNEIIDGIRKGIDITYILYNKYNYLQMKIIKDTLCDNIDPEPMLSDVFDWDQMYQIRLGLLNNIDVTYYNDPSINVTDMIKIRKQLQGV